MIISSIENALEQVSKNQRLEKALKFLRDSNLENLPEGRFEIEGDKLFAIVQTYQTRPAGTFLELEGHKKYIDIQCVVTGQELIGWIHAGSVQASSPYDEAKDAWLGNLAVEKLTMLRLAEKQVAIFFPTDAHAPQVADGISTQVKKIVIKIATEMAE
ncbi:MAG: YhcH/YjgK/YiaL family protein [Chloroflexota bacterium]